ncbi:hypothetical protein L0337_14455 [candidate division KSB1 bacterium]|nr:hypothetical protein [candidate division KSB1 bacterium]
MMIVLTSGVNELQKIQYIDMMKLLVVDHFKVGPACLWHWQVSHLRKGASERDEKSPVLAFVMSCLVPGAGQYYNGDIAKGVIQEVLVVGAKLSMHF